MFYCFIRSREFDAKTPAAVWLPFPVSVHLLLCSFRTASSAHVTINKRGPPEVSELVANHADSLQLHIRGVLLTRRFHFTLVLPEIKIVVNKIAAVCHFLDFTDEFTTILSVPQLQMRRWK